MSEMINIKEFARMDLRIATVKEAKKVEGADKLLVLQVDLGDEQRQVVAGVAEHYDPADLEGRQVVLIANLAPAKIRGVKSRGMVLAAKSGDTLCLLAPEKELPPGATVS